MPTILITSCPSGFGPEAARLFIDPGHEVVPAMRTPDGDALPSSNRLRMLRLDVIDTMSVSGVGPASAININAEG